MVFVGDPKQLAPHMHQRDTITSGRLYQISACYPRISDLSARELSKQLRTMVLGSGNASGSKSGQKKPAPRRDAPAKKSDNGPSGKSGKKKSFKKGNAQQDQEMAKIAVYGFTRPTPEGDGPIDYRLVFLQVTNNALCTIRPYTDASLSEDEVADFEPITVLHKEVAEWVTFDKTEDVITITGHETPHAIAFQAFTSDVAAIWEREGVQAPSDKFRELIIPSIEHRRKFMVGFRKLSSFEGFRFTGGLETPDHVLFQDLPALANKNLGYASALGDVDSIIGVFDEWKGIAPVITETDVRRDYLSYYLVEMKETSAAQFPCLNDEVSRRVSWKGYIDGISMQLVIENYGGPRQICHTDKEWCRITMPADVYRVGQINLRTKIKGATTFAVSKIVDDRVCELLDIQTDKQELQEDGTIAIWCWIVAGS